MTQLMPFLVALVFSIIALYNIFSFIQGDRKHEDSAILYGGFGCMYFWYFLSYDQQWLNSLVSIFCIFTATLFIAALGFRPIYRAVYSYGGKSGEVTISERRRRVRGFATWHVLSLFLYMNIGFGCYFLSQEAQSVFMLNLVHLEVTIFGLWCLGSILYFFKVWGFTSLIGIIVSPVSLLVVIALQEASEFIAFLSTGLPSTMDQHVKDPMVPWSMVILITFIGVYTLGIIPALKRYLDPSNKPLK